MAFGEPNATKFVIDRINQTEKYLSGMCAQFGKVCRKEAQVRDCNDQLVENMTEFAARETLNTSLKHNLQQYANYLSAVEDYRQTLITRVETQILEPLAKYGEVLKIKRNAVHRAVSARDKGVQRQRKLQLTSDRNPGNREAIVTLRVDAEHAQTEATRAVDVVQDEIDKFEQMKLTDIKKYLIDFTLIHLAFHARAVEMYTNAYQQLLKIDVQHDMTEFHKAAPFQRLQPSQRSVSETVLNIPTRPTAPGVTNRHGGSLNVLTNDRRNSDLGSEYSSQTDTSPYRGGSLGRASDQRSQSTRSGVQTSTLGQSHSLKQNTFVSNTRNKPSRVDVPESVSDSDDSDN